MPTRGHCVNLPITPMISPGPINPKGSRHRRTLPGVHVNLIWHASSKPQTCPEACMGGLLNLAGLTYWWECESCRHCRSYYGPPERVNLRPETLNPVTAILSGYTQYYPNITLIQPQHIPYITHYSSYPNII